MSKIINISDNFIIDLCEVSQIGKMIEMKENSPMFCFTIGFIGGSYRNVCLHYNADNKTIIKQQAKKLHRKIEEKVHGSKVQDSE